MKKFLALVAVGLLILGAASCDTKNIGIFGGNLAPTINSATFNPADDTLTVALTDQNAADTVTVTCSDIPGLSVNSPRTFSKTGSVVFQWTADVPATGGTGNTTVTATDTGGLTASTTAAITVDPVVPGALNITNVDYTGDTLTVSVTDTNNADVTVSVSSPAGLTPSATSHVVAGGNGDAVFTWAGAPGTTGVTTITATEGANTDTATQSITIPLGPPNDPPVIVSTAYAEPTLTVNVTNAPAGEDVIVSVTSPAGLTPDAPSKTLTGGNGAVTFTWTGAAGTTGDTTISANDGVNAAVTATETISIAPAPVDTAPVIASNPYVEATATLTVNVTNAPAGQDVTVAVTSPAGLTPDAPSKTLTGGNGAVTFTWTGAPGTTGDTTISADDSVNPAVTAIQTISIAPAANTAPTIDSHNYAEPTLTVVTTDVDGDLVTVTPTAPAGMTVSPASGTTAAGGGTLTFVFSANDPFVATGPLDTTIAANDTVNPDVTATQAITLTAWPLAADTLYARPAKNTAAVGEAVTVYVYTGQVPNPLQFMSSVGFTVETAGTYVGSSFNVGWPGGLRTDTDGYWALLGPPAPANGAYLDLGDALMPGAATDIGGGLHRYNFAVVTQGPFAAPAAIGTGQGPVLYTFQVSFSAANIYHLGFQLNDGAFDQTYYSDQNGTNFFWGTLDGSNTITVN